MDICVECNKALIVSSDREECLDMCDTCWSELQERVRLMSNHDYRMRAVRAAVDFCNRASYGDRQEETKLRAFFGTVMPEIPQHKVEKIIKDVKNKIDP